MPVCLHQPVIPTECMCVKTESRNNGEVIWCGIYPFDSSINKTRWPALDLHISIGRCEEGYPGNAPTSKMDSLTISNCLLSLLRFVTTRTTPQPQFAGTHLILHTLIHRRLCTCPFLSPSLTLPQLLNSFPCAVWNSWTIIGTISYAPILFPEHSLYLPALTAIWNSPKDSTFPAVLSYHDHFSPPHSTTGPEGKAGVPRPSWYFQIILSPVSHSSLSLLVIVA